MPSASLPARGRERAAWTRSQRLKNDLIYVAVRGLIAVLVVLPLGVSAAICRGIGALAYVLLPGPRRLARDRLRAGLGERSASAPAPASASASAPAPVSASAPAPVSASAPAPASALTSPERRVRLAFGVLGSMLADTLALLRPAERAARSLSLDPPSRAVFRDALAEGRGVVFIAAHLGPWERMAALLVEEGFPVATVARESYDPRFTELYERIRRPRGVRSIYRGSPGAATAIVRELARAGAVGFLMDLPARVPCARVRLFGEEADVPIGPARIALARRAAVVVGTCAPPPLPPLAAAAHRGGMTLGRVQITRVRSDDLAPGPAGEAELVARLARAVEERIEAWPEAWLGLFAPPRLRGADVPR